MEYRECRCPACHEVMQVPVDRDKIICMFCGQNIMVITDEGGASDSRDAAYFLQRFKELAPELKDKQAKFNGLFNKKHYPGGFIEFKTQFKPFLDDIYTLCVFITESRPGFDASLIDSCAGALAEDLAALTLTEPKKRDRQQQNAAMNMYMVTYLLPAIDSYGPELTEDVVNGICRAWKDHFPMGNILPSDYESLNAGFKRGIFGLFQGKI